MWYWQSPWSGAPSVTFTLNVALSSTRRGLKWGAGAQLIQLQDSNPSLALCKISRRKWSHLCVKLAQLAAFICGRSGICWWEQTSTAWFRASQLLQAPFPAVFGTSGVAPAGIGPWMWLEGPEGGQLTAVISPCCSLSAAQALLHCKDIAARQLGRVGREFSQRCQSFLGEAESCSLCSCGFRDRPGESNKL